MALLKDVLSKESQSKLEKIKKNMNNDQIINAGPNAKVVGFDGRGYVGATPDLNSSLGTNSFAGETTKAYLNATGDAVYTDQSKLSTFWSKNATWLTGLGGSILGGGQTQSTSGGSYAPPSTTKKGIPAWVWILISIVVLVVIVLIIKKASKK
jgi:hypothetical protein